MAVLSMTATRNSGAASCKSWRSQYNGGREHTLPCPVQLDKTGVSQVQGAFTSAASQRRRQVPSILSGQRHSNSQPRIASHLKFSRAAPWTKPVCSLAASLVSVTPSKGFLFLGQESREQNNLVVRPPVSFSRQEPQRKSTSLALNATHRCRLRSSQSLGLLRRRQRGGCHPLQSAFCGEPFFPVYGVSVMRTGRQRGRGSAIACSCSMDLAANMFTFGTAMVVPFYTLMLAAPTWRGTRKLMDSAIPYVILGAMYMYLLCISWTPEHPKLMFSSKYWLPELPGITRMFSSMLTVSSAWIHLLAVDLFAGRNIYLDSITNNLPCRHSLILCLMFGPVGIFSHLFTKNVVMAWRKATKSEKDNTAQEAGPIDVFPNQPFAGLGPQEAATA